MRLLRTVPRDVWTDCTHLIVVVEVDEQLGHRHIHVVRVHGRHRVLVPLRHFLHRVELPLRL